MRRKAETPFFCSFKEKIIRDIMFDKTRFSVYNKYVINVFHRKKMLKGVQYV